MIYVVTYIDVQSGSTTEGIELLKQYREASGAEVFQETCRPNRFVIVETWKDESSFQSHETAAHTASFRASLRAIQNSPHDQRVHQGFSVGTELRPLGAGKVFVVTHVDVLLRGKTRLGFCSRVWPNKAGRRMGTSSTTCSNRKRLVQTISRYLRLGITTRLSLRTKCSHTRGNSARRSRRCWVHLMTSASTAVSVDHRQRRPRPLPLPGNPRSFSISTDEICRSQLRKLRAGTWARSGMSRSTTMLSPRKSASR